MKILAWNVALNYTDNSKELDRLTVDRPQKIVDRILQECPDIIVLTEYNGWEFDKCKEDQQRPVIKKYLDKEYDCKHSYYEKKAYISTFIGVKKVSHAGRKLCAVFNEHNRDDFIIFDKNEKKEKHWGRNWYETSINDGELYLLGVHIPNDDGDENIPRNKFFNKVEAYAKDKKNKNAIIVGDFNAFDRKDGERDSHIDKTSAELDKIRNNGWIDAWEEYCQRANNDIERYTYCANGFGRRLDYAFVTENLKDRIHFAKHLHDVRLSGLSDHSALVVEIDLEGK